MSNDYTIYAVKTIQYWEDEKAHGYWTPQIFKELKNGRARFGWSYKDDFNLHTLEKKLQKKDEWEKFDEEEKKAWYNGWFLLYTKPGDYFIYINMPEYGKCTIVKISGIYDFSESWDKEKEGDFRHYLPCKFVGVFGRNDAIVHPFLSNKLKLRRAWYRVYAQAEFEELLAHLEEGTTGEQPEERLRKDVRAKLLETTGKIHQNFPRKPLEALVLKILKKLPGVTDVRKGPDVNGADLDMEFESGLGIEGMQKTELCAVQVKSYEGDIGYAQAIKDIERAFASNPDYTCGLIVSTALKMTESFEEQLNELRRKTKKDIGVLIGADLSRLLIKYLEDI